MNREGIVHRRTARADPVAVAQQEVDDRRSGSDEEREDLDSKETRLTLMEEVLLLGLKDKEVGSHSIIMQVVIYLCLIESLLM